MLVGGAILGTVFLFVFVRNTKTLRQEILVSTRTSDTARSIETALITHQRDNYFYQITADKKYLDRKLRARTELHRLLDILENQQGAPNEDAGAKAVIQSVRDYLAEYEDLQSRRKSPLEIYSRLSEPAGQTRREVQELIRNNDVNVEGTRRQLRLWETRATQLSYVFASLILIVFLGLLFLWHKLIYKPIEAVLSSIRNFHSNDKVPEPTKLGVFEIQKLSEAFHELGNRLQDESTARFRFLAAVAHDLKNPLGVIQMASDQMRTDVTLSEAEKSEIIQIVERQAKSLTTLVEDLMLVTTCEAGELKIRRETHDIRQTLRDVAELSSRISGQHKINLSIPANPMYCNLDLGRLNQILHNLVSNAIKYFPQGGVVRINAKVESGRVFVSIIDEGLGIPKKDLPRIFEPFHRGGLDSSPIRGLGLGLASAKMLVEAMGGHLLVQSELGFGSEFTIDFPEASQPST